MKCNKIIVCLLILFISINHCELLTFADEININNYLYSLDSIPELKPMTEDEIRLREETSIQSEHVNFNDLALKRINEELREEGKEEVYFDTVEFGEETVTSDNDITFFSTQSTKSPIPIAKKIDNSTDPNTAHYFPPIAQQGALGSCGAFASTYYQMTYMKAFASTEYKYNDKYNEEDALAVKDSLGNANYNRILSPKFTYNIGKKGDDHATGMWPSTAYAIVQKHGCPFWKDFPYMDVNNDEGINPEDYLEWPSDAEIWKDALQNKVKQSGWGYVGEPDDETPISNEKDENLNLIKSYLINGYVLNVVGPTTGWLYKEAEGTGINVCIAVTGEKKWHAMTVVGYDDTIWVDINKNNVKDDGECGAFKLINSWGNYKSEIWMAYDALNKKSAVDKSTRYSAWVNNEFTWVTMYENYTPKLLAEFTINTDNRGAVNLALGYSSISADKPTEQWKPFIFNETKYGGEEYIGNNCFNIKGIPEDNENNNSATIILDYTDLINEKEADRIDEELKWYLSSNADISDFKLIDIRTKEQKQDDNNWTYRGIDYPSSDTLPNDSGVISSRCQLPLEVDKNKVWNISVNYPLNPNTVNKSTVKVKNDSGNNLFFPVSLNNDTEIMIKPSSAYTSGKYYSLEINGIKTIAGNGLKNPIIKYFYVAPDNEVEVDYSIESSFTDSNFLGVIRELVQKPNGVVYLSDVRDIKELDVSNSNITNLDGIEYFTSLEKLNCSNNNITELDLSRNIKLTTLDVSNNKLTELDLSHNTLLTDVNVNGNDLNPTLVGLKINNGYNSSSNDYNDYINEPNEYGNVIDLLEKDSLPLINFVGKKVFTYVKLENSIFVDKLILKMSTNNANAEIKNENIVLTHIGDGIFTGISSGAYGDSGLAASFYDGKCELVYTKKHDDLHKEIVLGSYEVEMRPGI